MATATPPAAEPPVRPGPRVHPLEPLDAGETARARDALAAAGLLAKAVVVNTVTLAEPPKEEVMATGTAPAGQPQHLPPRRAEAVFVDRATGRASRAIVDVEARAVLQVVDLGDRQPSLTPKDQVVAVLATRADPAWQRAVRARGIDDVASVQVDPWPTGDFVPPELRERRLRLARCVAFHRPKPADNGYARPLSGLVALVDVNAGRVVHLEDHGVVPLPPTDGNYDVPPDGAPFRRDLKPIAITQPEGPSFTIAGHHVRWQNWDFRVSLHPIEGLVLHQVGYRDRSRPDDPGNADRGDPDGGPPDPGAGDPGAPGHPDDDGHPEGRLRSILYRASLAEMVVPYGDPGPDFHWRNAFDAGEVGLGKSVNALQLGCDCLGEIHYFDGLTVDHRGNPVVQPNAICMHEEDYGVLWKHTDVVTGDAHTRRSRRLVVSSFSTLGNYEYGTFWYFYLDGTIQLEMKLTGIVATRAVAPGDPPGHAVEVAPRLTAPHHQHLFCFRLDFDVDGVDNTVYEVDVVPSPADPEANPFGNAFDVVRAPITHEAEAGRLADASRSRTWHVVNEGRRNRLGQPVGYKLEPHVGPTLLAHPRSSIGRRAAFATRHLWVTRHDPAQMRPGGEFPNQSTGDADGIAAWVRADRPLRATDTVVWHTFGPTHVSRPEDWPVMPVEYAGFTLKPVGFFDRNPALDVPPTPAATHCHQPSS